MLNILKYNFEYPQINFEHPYPNKLNPLNPGKKNAQIITLKVVDISKFQKHPRSSWSTTLIQDSGEQVPVPSCLQKTRRRRRKSI
jgi:hypothetical protein